MQYMALCVWLISLSINFQGSSVFYQVSVLHSFLWLNSTPLYGENTFYLSIHGHWVVPSFWLVWITAQLLRSDSFPKNITFFTSSLILVQIFSGALLLIQHSRKYLVFIKSLAKFGLKLLFLFIAVFLTISKIRAPYEW